jgi:hypothetical protein
MNEWKWETKLTVACIIVAGIIEAGEQALAGSPSLKGALTGGLPSFLVSPKLHYAPLTLLIIAGVVWLFGKVSKRTNVSAPKLNILSAAYGSSSVNDMDVTEILRKRVGNALVVTITNELFGRDPAPNIPKRLQVDYSYGNQASRVIRPENSRLVLPEDSWLVAEVEGLRKGASANQQERQNGVKANDAPLAQRILVLVTELKAFLGSFGPEPEVIFKSGMNAEAFNEANKEGMIRSRKMEASFYRRYHQRIGDIYNEACELGTIHDPTLEQALRSRVDNDQVFKTIIERLAAVAVEVAVQQA